MARDDRLLFAEEDLGRFLDGVRTKAETAALSVGADIILSRSIDALAEEIVEQHRVLRLEVAWDRARQLRRRPGSTSAVIRCVSSVIRPSRSMCRARP